MTNYSQSQHKSVLDYARSYLESVTCRNYEDKETLIGLPNPYISPNHLIYKNDQFYWDSYFTVVGLLAGGETKMAKGMVENFIYLFQRFGLVPMRNRFFNTGGSQPPFLTAMAMAVYRETNNKRFLKKVMNAAAGELERYWENHWHLHMASGLSRYVDHFVTHATAEHESGWDMTSRFDEHCLNFLPVDLNCLLYRYDEDLAEMADIFNLPDMAKHFSLRASTRKRMINKFMWNKEKGFFFDYNHISEKPSQFFSVAGYYPLWSGLATRSQAKLLVGNLKRFECSGGLANTQRIKLSQEYRQHDYPNGWPHQQWIIIDGLRRYGYENEAKRLTKKWLDLITEVYLKNDLMWEKYDVVKRDVGKSGRYDTQEGFSWTCGTYIALYSYYYNN